MSPIGYARVSTREDRQLLDRQLDALQAAGCERIFDDRMTGIQADRPGLIACLDHLRTGDVLVVLDLDRLGRRARDLIGLIEDLEKRGIAFKALNSPMDTTTPAGRAFLQIQAAFAEMERNLIRQRVNLTEFPFAVRTRIDETVLWVRPAGRSVLPWCERAR